MTDTDDFCSPEVENQPKAAQRKRSAAPKRDRHGLTGSYGKKRKVTPGRVFGGKKVSTLAGIYEADVINNPDMSLSKLRES
jgi:hypothetical protein